MLPCTEGDDYLCCDAEQIKKMEQSLQLADGIFGRCQTCLKNFHKSICAFSCSSEQSRFVKRNVSTMIPGKFAV